MKHYRNYIAFDLTYFMKLWNKTAWSQLGKCWEYCIYTTCIMLPHILKTCKEQLLFGVELWNKNIVCFLRQWVTWSWALVPFYIPLIYTSIDIGMAATIIAYVF